MTTDNKTGIWWRYILFLAIIVFAGPATYFTAQALRGHPVDPNYFWTEWSPFGLFGGRLYNGKGGANWKIGEAKANILNADELRKLSEVRQFALELVNRDRNLNTLDSVVIDPILNSNKSGGRRKGRAKPTEAQVPLEREQAVVTNIGAFTVAP